MIRKIQQNRDLSFVFIPKAFVEHLGLHKGQRVDIRIKNSKIEIAPTPNANPESVQASKPKGVPV